MARMHSKALAFAVALSAAADVEVRLVPEASAAAQCVNQGWVTATNGNAILRTPVVKGQHVYRLTLPADALWEITAEIAGCWSESTRSTSDDRAVPLSIHRVATVAGTFETDARTKPDGAMRGVVFPVRSGGAGDSLGVSGLSTPCELDFPRWQCSVPANVPLDLRLELPGFGALHYWDVTAAEGGVTKLPSQRLLAGATLAGWIQDSDRNAVPGARVTLHPMIAHAPFPERERLVARRHVVVADARGFFQIAGLEAGVYRLVSEARGFSPVAVPEMRVREGESLVWPRPIVQPPVARLEVLLSPPLDPSGSPWLVELQERAPLHLEPTPPVQRKAGEDGRWEAAGLRADWYRLRVRDRNGSPLENLTIDLTEGGTKTVPIEVRSIAVRGILFLGDEPLAGHLTFTNYSGRDVDAQASRDGRFTAIFPAGGAWVPALDGRIELEPVNIDPDDDRPIELHVPGGRIRGEVVGPQKTPARGAVVHLLRDGAGLFAHATTGDDGEFEIIGVPAGSYEIQASGNRIATPNRMKLQMSDDETKDLTLVLAPMRHIEAVVLTPFGTAASGAMVKISPDGGRMWLTLSADAAGRIAYSAPSESGDVLLVVVTYAWPGASARVPADVRDPITVRLQPQGGTLRVRNAPFPVLRTPELTAPLMAFQIPPPQGRRTDPAHLAPGTYVVCPDRDVADGACRSVTIVPGTERTIDFAPKEDQKKGAS